jgi:aspartate carbamoyltransferase regulatory subunit
MIEQTLLVSAIKEGSVIDHLTPGSAVKIISLLKLTEHHITVGLNLKSRSMHFKDLIKIENYFLSSTLAGQIAIFSPKATINVIENFQVAKKFQVQLPETIHGCVSCPNPRCITHREPVETSFTVEESSRSVILQCRYCEKLFNRDELREKISPQR